MREKYQISFWRCDQFTCVKTKDAYFTPKSARFLKRGRQRFQGFEMLFSLDKEHIVLAEKKVKNMKEQLIVILDACTLEVVDEHVVPYSLEYIAGLDADPADEEGYDDGWSEYNTLRHVPTVYVWDKGRYVMYGQTMDKAVSIFQYEVLDVKERKKYVLSKEKCKVCFFVDFKVSPGNAEVLYVGGYGYHNAYCYEMDIKKETIRELSKAESSEARPTFYALDESCTKQYHSRVTSIADKSVCKVYSTPTDESTTIDVSSKSWEYQDNKPTYTGKTDGNNLIGMEYNERNELVVKVTGQVNFSQTLPDFGADIDISKVEDYGLCNNNAVIMVTNVNKNSFDVIFVRNKEGNSARRHHVEETTFIYFNYPNIVMVKGGREIITYSITEDMYYYTKLGAPILFQNSMKCSVYDTQIKCFIDLGDYIAYTDFTFYPGTASSSGTIYKRFLEKVNFPDSRLISGFDTMQCKYGTKEEDSYVLHFKDFIYCNAINKYGLTSVTEAKYEPDELWAISGFGFFTYKKDRKTISMYQRPCNFGDTNSAQSMYESAEYIKRMKIMYDDYSGTYYFDIADEVKYLKRYKLDTSKDKWKLAEPQEFFVHSAFGGRNNFTFVNEMVYNLGTSSYITQKRGEESEALGQLIKPDISAIDVNEVSSQYPLESKNWLLLYGPLLPQEGDHEEIKQEVGGDSDSSDYEDYDSIGEEGYGVILLPQYNEPKVQILPPNEVSYYKKEYFFYHNNNYLVYHKQSYNNPH